MATIQVLDRDGKQTGTVELGAGLLGGGVRGPLLHQAVVRELADRRVGTHDTRGRSEVSGGGKKPWKQKGPGRARQGSIRATQWKGGGKPFGPTPRRYDKDLPRGMRREALRAAVAAAVARDAVKVVESVGAEGRTKPLVAALAALGVAGAPTLLVVGALPEPMLRAARNVPWLEVETATHVSVYQLVRARHVVLERAALAALEEALVP